MFLQVSWYILLYSDVQVQAPWQCCICVSLGCSVIGPLCTPTILLVTLLPAKIECQTGSQRVFILGIRELTKMRCRNGENKNYIDGIQDLTALRVVGLAKIWAWNAGFIMPSYCPLSPYWSTKSYFFAEALTCA